MDSIAAGFDSRLAKALSHPTRAKSLRILNERTASPSDIAAELGLPVANVSYHVTSLLRLGCIEEVETRHVRGAVEHFYRGIRRPWATLDDVEEMPSGLRNQWFSDIAAVAFDDLRRAAVSEAVEARADFHASWTRLRLDRQGWTELYHVLDQALCRAVQIHEAAAARLDASGAGCEEVPAILSMFFYESPSAVAVQG